MDTPKTHTRLDRREAIKWMLAASATVPFLSSKSKGQGGPAIPTPGGYGHDPNLLGAEIPWDRTLSEEQLKTVSSVCDAILPRVDDSPSASELNVPDFMDEWVSAPYPDQRADREIVLNGLDWINEESEKRFGKPFHEIGDHAPGIQGHGVTSLRALGVDADMAAVDAALKANFEAADMLLLANMKISWGIVNEAEMAAARGAD